MSETAFPATFAAWERCKHWIEAALETSPGFETIDDVWDLIDRGVYRLCIGPNSAAVAEICEYATCKAVVIVHAGGDKRELIEGLEPIIAAYGLEHGCDMIAVTGRKGWEREGLKHGYRFGFVTMVRDLKQ